MNPNPLKKSDWNKDWNKTAWRQSSRPFLRLSLGLMLVAVGLVGFCGESPALAPQSRQLYLEAQRAERNGNPEVAERALRQAIAMDPTDYLNYVKLASILNQQGKSNEAVSFYHQALLLNPQDTMVLYSLGAVEEQLGHYAKAEEDYQLSLQNNPRYQFALLNLARVEIQQKKYEPAIAHYQQFLTRYPDHYEARRHLARLYLVTGREAESVRQYDFLKQRFPDRFGDHLNLARALNGVNAPQKALEELRIAYAKEGGKADINEEMGRAHASLRQNDLAIYHYRKAYSLNPEKDELLLKIAELNRSGKKTAQAVEDYQAFLKRHPDDASARWMLADTYLDAGSYEPALNEMALLLPTATDAQKRYSLRKDMAYATQMLGDYPKAIAMYEELLSEPQAAQDLQLRSNLAIAYHRSGNYEKAIPLYKQIDQADTRLQKEYQINRASLSNDLASALTSVGDAAYKQGDYPSALTAYGEATLHAGPKNYWPYLGLGNACYALKMPEKAYEAYGKVLERDPGNVTARLYRTRLAMEMREAGEKAPSGTVSVNPDDIATLERLAREHPNNLEVLTTLGGAYERQGNATAAISTYEKALALTPANTDLMLAIGGQWQKLGNFEQARNVYLRSLTVDDRQPMVYYNLGIVYNELGQLSESEAAYRQAIALEPAQADSRYGLAITQEKQRKYQEALESYQSYASDPQARYGKEALSRIEILQQALAASSAQSGPGKTMSPPAVSSPVQPSAASPAKGETGKTTSPPAVSSPVQAPAASPAKGGTGKTMSQSASPPAASSRVQPSAASPAKGGTGKTMSQSASPPAASSRVQPSAALPAKKTSVSTTLPKAKSVQVRMTPLVKSQTFLQLSPSVGAQPSPPL